MSSVGTRTLSALHRINEDERAGPAMSPSAHSRSAGFQRKPTAPSIPTPQRAVSSRSHASRQSSAASNLRGMYDDRKEEAQSWLFACNYQFRLIWPRNCQFNRHHFLIVGRIINHFHEQQTAVTFGFARCCLAVANIRSILEPSLEWWLCE